MPAALITLKNRALVARFAPDSGRLVHLSRDGLGEGLIRNEFCRFYDEEARRWHGGGERAADAFPSVSARTTGASFTSIRRDEHLEAAIAYALDPGHSLLRVHVKVRSLGETAKLILPAMPRFELAPDFMDTFADEEDLYFDGAELGDGRELPCWRVFFRKGHRDGLLLATRCKTEMSRFEISADAFELHPHTFFNYTTYGLGSRPALNPAEGKTYEARFEIGPWEKTGHAKILRAAQLNEPFPARNPPPSGKFTGKLKGKIFDATRLASASIATRNYASKKWMIAKMPWARKGRALFAGTGVRPPRITLNPCLKGLYRVFVGIGNGAGVTLRAAGDPETRYRISSELAGKFDAAAFHLWLSGRHRSAEVDFGAMAMDGKKLSIGRFPDLHQPCVLDYVRFEKLSPLQAKQWEREEKTEPVLPLSGLNDIPDIAAFTDARNPAPRAYTANIWEHANCKVRKIYWRIDGQCSDYPSKVNTMRYILARVHGVFHPQSKAYGRVLKKVDMLKLAAAAARKYGVSLWGWMRFNSYMGNVVCDFYRDHPEYWEEWEYGGKGRQLCLAHKAVRDHKIAILIEAAKYGLDGVCLGFLRHPPVVQYAQIMRDAYREKYGKEPPRNPNHPDGHHLASLPDRGDDEYPRWWQFRAGYLTQFGRELRAALKKNGLSHIKIAIWVRPNHCLFDGIDLPAWLDEGLCDEVVTHEAAGKADRMDLYWEKPEWKQMVRAKVPLIRGIPMWIKPARAMTRRILAEGYDGICTYESDYTVLDSRFINLYRSLCGSTNALPRGA